jgi:hypothetical protein
MRFAVLSLAIELLGGSPAPGLPAEPAIPAPAAAPDTAPYGAWKNGPSTDPGFFPIAVWLQDPRNAARYKAAGFNLYIGLWKGPTEAQLSALKAAGMRVICDQNAVGLAHLLDPTIAGWMHGDEPDNAQEIPGGKGYGPPILPERIIADYDRIRKADPTRPVILNLGQGVAWDGWYGRGVRTNHPEDYREYAKGGDIISFDIYPVVHSKPEIRGKLWYVPRGVDRLIEWTGGKKIIWNCIECTHIGDPTAKATPAQVRSEIWMSIIHGTRGLIWFVHEFEPKFVEAGLLADSEMLAAATSIHERIRELAPVINSPSVEGAVTVTSSDAKVPIDILVKRRGGATFIFAAAMRDTPVKGRFEIQGNTGKLEVEVLDEGRTIQGPKGRFEDTFEGYGVHIYEVR